MRRAMEGQSKEIKGEGEEGGGDDHDKSHPTDKTGGETQQ
jgi:hypothetical protein